MARLLFQSGGCNQFITQRTLGSRSLRDGQLGIMLAAFIKLAIPFIIVFPGIMALQLYGGQIVNGDEAYPILIKNLLPVGLRGILFAALFGAVMSSLDSMLNSASSIFTMDLYRRHLRPDQGFTFDARTDLDYDINSKFAKGGLQLNIGGPRIAIGSPVISIPSLPNTAIQPERGRSFDVGVKVEQRTFRGSIGYFKNDIKNFSQTIMSPSYCIAPNPALGVVATPFPPCLFSQSHAVQFFQRISRDAKAHFSGWEFSGEVAIPLAEYGSLTPFATFSYLKSVDDAPNTLPAWFRQAGRGSNVHNFPRPGPLVMNIRQC